MKISPPDVAECMLFADAGIRDTIHAFIRHPLGFHGDTGIQNYLYHRLMTNAGNRVIWPPLFGAGQSTLLLQVEQYTSLTYQRTGTNPSPGRFDLAFVDAGQLEASNLGTCTLPAAIAIEVGRNKSAASILGHVDALEEASGPEPGDAAKLVRELKFGTLKVGYLLEFFDGSKGGNPVGAISRLIQDLVPRVSDMDGRLRIALVGYVAGGKPAVWLYPNTWAEAVCLDDHDLVMLNKEVKISPVAVPLKSLRPVRGKATWAGSESRTTFATFCERCSGGGQHLQEVLHLHTGRMFQLLYGGKSMTINHIQLRRVARIGNTLYRQGEIIEVVNPRFEEGLKKRLGGRMINGQVRIREERDDLFVSAVLDALKDDIGGHYD